MNGLYSPADRKVAIEDCDSYRMESVNRALDNLFESLGLETENPFASMIKPGMTVFIKPNWVASRWRESCPHKDTLYCVITHPAVVEAVADRVALALQGKGKIYIADNPSIDANFDELMEFTRIKRLENKYDVECKVFDLRPLVCPSLDVYGQKDKMVAKAGDPNGEVEINLGKKSLLYNVDSSLFRGVFEQREDTVASHTGETQLYTFARSVYDADVFISIPKLKTHQKVGATLNLKGLVGTVTNKNQLVHWRVGYPDVGGDEYPDKLSYDKSRMAKVTHRGAWPGNDTIWRMVVDLFNALVVGSSKRYFTVIDGIIAGEGQGPFCTTSKYANTLIAGEDFLLSDIAAVRYMGLSPDKISYLSYFINAYDINLEEDIEVYISGERKEHFFNGPDKYKDFYVVNQWQNIKI